MTKTTINHADMTEEALYRKRYSHCRGLIDNDPRSRGMSEEEEDTYAQSLATTEYLDLTCDWAFKYLSRTTLTCSLCSLMTFYKINHVN